MTLHSAITSRISPIACLIFATSLISGLNFSISAESPDRQSYKIYVDSSGVMRRTDNNDEVSYYGTNYTLPFAHAYRAMNNLNIDHKSAIDRDTYHFSRLGFNGFRLHLWDVEISDSAGNLLNNEHLDLLDYLIAALEKRNIDIILTAQTNFGNGYPEKNIDTGAFTYDFNKCDIHADKKAQKIQENYLQQLASHINPYTGRSYGNDNAIIAMEINNEPCHTAQPKEVTEYINKMAKALKKGGFNKPILYNVSHNPDVTEAYYDAGIQGTTYQWYPTGLVAGHERKGNFLPAVDQYPIPWKNSIKNYDRMARVVYEFDPGDVLYSYLYPAIARTFRKEGFQWITQFAYDPTDMARFNTEYQTHFLNLAYTPAKAISMMIAAEAARDIKRGADFGVFPVDTVFENFRVSYDNDLSELNSPDKFYYSNTTTSQPRQISDLKHIAGHGSSPVVEYEGTGAYFLDKTDIDGIWRLEVMPDIMLTSDPFKKPSLNKEVGEIVYRLQPMKINIPALGNSFSFANITNEQSGVRKAGSANEGQIEVFPGVYLLADNREALLKALENEKFMKSGITEFVAPENRNVKNVVIHTPQQFIPESGEVEITAEIFGSKDPDAVTIYPSEVSFWSDNNKLFPMEKVSGFTYRAVIPADQLGHGNTASYNIVVTEDGEDTTFPQNVSGNPLDWDFTANEYYVSRKTSPSAPAILLNPRENDPILETAMIPEAWNFRLAFENNTPVADNFYSLNAHPENKGLLVLRRYVGDELKGAPIMVNKKEIVLKLGDSLGLEDAEIAIVGKNGATYSAKISPTGQTPENIVRIPLSSLQQRSSLIIPAPYPSFLPREVEVNPLPFQTEEIDFIQLIIPTEKDREIAAKIGGIWLE